MDNQQSSQNQNPDNQTNTLDQPEPQSNYTPPVVPVTGNSLQTKSKKKGLWLLVATLIILVGLGGGAAYALLVYIPEKPENVLKLAALNLSKQSGNYNLTGRLDHGDANLPDFTIDAIKDTAGSTEISVSANLLVLSPRVAVRSVNNALYIKLDDFKNSQELSKKLINAGTTKSIDEYLALFVDNSNIVPNLGVWLQIDDYITSSADTGTTKAAPQVNESSFKITSIGGIEDINGKKARKYEITLTGEGFEELLATLTGSGSSYSLISIFNNYVDNNGFTDISVNVWISPSKKKVEQISYSGRPFNDATLEFKLVAKEIAKIDAPELAKISQKLGYGIVWAELFNPKMQLGSSVKDKERIADLKGIKTALEIYKTKKGYYPDRYDMSVNHTALLSGAMKGVDYEVFRDPAGRFIGLNGSQYAYVPGLKSGGDSCSKTFSTACDKYFIITTLDNGKEYQLNSD